MQCRLCGHPKTHKHGKTSKGSQRYICPNCQKTFTETFDTLYYRRQMALLHKDGGCQQFPGTEQNFV